MGMADFMQMPAPSALWSSVGVGIKGPVMNVVAWLRGIELVEFTGAFADNLVTVKRGNGYRVRSTNPMDLQGHSSL